MQLKLFISLGVLLGLTAVCAPPARAIGPAAKRSGVHVPEAVEMFAAVLIGSKMGPGDGWFHPSRSRYTWDWLAGRFDKDGDGTVTREEFSGPKELFDRLDRDGSGSLTADDFDWSEQAAFVKEGRAARGWFGRLDQDSNGRISKEEWARLFERAAKGKAYLTPDDLREAFPLTPPRPNPKAAEAQEPSTGTLLRGLFNGELGSLREGPELGQAAPDFSLKTLDGKRTVRLADYRGKKPVVLVFGSFT